jgi:hypothetical protein
MFKASTSRSSNATLSQKTAYQMQSKRHAREIAASPANRQNSTPFRVFDLDVFVYTSRPSETAQYVDASMCKKKDEKIAMPVSV